VGRNLPCLGVRIAQYRGCGFTPAFLDGRRTREREYHTQNAGLTHGEVEPWRPLESTNEHVGSGVRSAYDKDGLAHFPAVDDQDVWARAC
jgi:hypothetical protein